MQQKTDDFFICVKVGAKVIKLVPQKYKTIQIYNTRTLFFMRNLSSFKIER